MKILSSFILTILLATSIAAGIVAAIWRWAPEQVVEFDANLVEEYVEEPRSELTRLTALAAQSPAEAVPRIREFVDELGMAAGKDRRKETRIRGVQLLASTLLKADKTEEGAEVAKNLAGENPFDHASRRWAARLLIRAGEPFTDEGFAMLEDLFAVFPEDPPLARALASARAQAGDKAAALEVALSHLEAVPRPDTCYEQISQDWLFAFAAKMDDLAEAPKRVLARDSQPTHMLLSATLPAEARYLRLAPKARPLATFGSPMVAITSDGTLEFADEMRELSVTAEGAAFHPYGLDFTGVADQWVTIELPAQSPASQGPRGVQIVLPKQRFPLWIEEALVTDEAAPRVRAILGRAADSVRARFFAERVRQSRAYGLAGMGLASREEGGAWSTIPTVVHRHRSSPAVPQGKADYDVTFETTIAATESAEALHLALPASAGAIFQLDLVEWTESASSPAGQVVELDQITPLDPSQLEATGDAPYAWRVLPGSEGPTLKIVRPSGSPTTCRLKGGLR
jgi:hypothetical protein